MKHFIKFISDYLMNLFQHRTVVTHETRTLSTTDKKRIARGVRAFFDRHYELRYNIIKQQEEFRSRQHDEADQKNSDGQNKNSDGQNFAGEHQNSADEHQHEGWRQMTDRELKAIAFEQMLEVGVAWSVDVELYVRSALTPDYTPSPTTSAAVVRGMAIPTTSASLHAACLPTMPTSPTSSTAGS